MTRDGSFDAFVDAAYPRLVRTAFLLVGDRGHAEDLVQAALYSTYTHWTRIDPAAAEAYARRTMIRAAGGWRRRRWRGEVPTVDLPDADASDHDRAAALDLLRALGELSPGFRAVLVLRYFDDLTEAETARVLGISVGTVKSRASRALTQLRADVRLARTDDEPREVRP